MKKYDENDDIQNKNDQESKRHHLVPQVYLDGWLNNDKKLYEFKRFLKSHNVKYKDKSTKSTGFSRYAYNLDGLPLLSRDIKKEYMEDVFFGKIDNLPKVPLENIRNGNVPSTSEQRSDFSVFLVSLIVRNKWFFSETRNSVNKPDQKSFAKSTMEEIRKFHIYDEFDIDHFISSENALDGVLVLLFEEIIHNKNIIDFIINCEWEIVAAKDFEFLTSDAPVWWSGFDNNNKDMFAMISASPTKSLIIANNKKSINIVKNTKTLNKQYNDQICKQAFEMVFSNNTAQYNFINNRLGRYQDHFGLSNYKFMKFFEKKRTGFYKTPIQETKDRLINNLML